MSIAKDDYEGLADTIVNEIKIPNIRITES